LASCYYTGDLSKGYNGTKVFLGFSTGKRNGLNCQIGVVKCVTIAKISEFNKCSILSQLDRFHFLLNAGGITACFRAAG